MLAKIDDDFIYIKDCTQSQFSVIRSWNKMKWNRKSNMFIGPLEIELLNKLAGIVKLPSRIEKYRQHLNAVQEEVDKIRNDKGQAEPFIKPPVKVNLFQHQIKALNMALVTFGIVEVT